MLYVLSIWDKSIEKTKPEQLCKTVPRATARHSQIWQILLAKYYKQTEEESSNKKTCKIRINRKKVLSKYEKLTQHTLRKVKVKKKLKRNNI